MTNRFKILLIVNLILLSNICLSNDKCFYINKTNSLAYSTSDSLLYSGSCIHYYRNGHKKGGCIFKNGILIASMGWYKNGQLSDSSYYIDNKFGAFEKSLSFEFYRWWENGNLQKKIIYKDGQVEGNYIYYYENGNIKEDGNCKMTKLDGIVRYYYKNGMLKDEIIWRDNSVISSKHWDKFGKLK